MINTVNIISIKDTVSKWNEEEYGILYYGKRSWGYNTEVIVYINNEVQMLDGKAVSSEIIGYTVSVYVPEKEYTYIPVRYNLVKSFNYIGDETLSKETIEQKKKLK